MAPVAAEAIVVLGCRFGPGQRLVGASRRRVETAADAWHDGVAPCVLASGGRRWRGVSEAEAFAAGLRDRGVDPDAVFLELRSLSTVENAEQSAVWLRKSGMASVAVVTCDWHMPRALACFRSQGLASVFPIAAASPPASPVARLRRGAREWLRRGWRRP